MKLCDPTNNVMFKSMSFLGKQQQTTSIHYNGDMYVHVSDKETLWKTKLNTCINLCSLDNQHPSES